MRKKVTERGLLQNPNLNYKIRYFCEELVVICFVFSNS